MKSATGKVWKTSFESALNYDLCLVACYNMYVSVELPLVNVSVIETILKIRIHAARSYDIAAHVENVLIPERI